jgi:hypothetical protein
MRRFDALNPVGRFSTPVPERKQKVMRAAGVHLTWSGERGWEISLAIVAPGRPSWAVTTRRAMRVHRPDAFGTALLARYGRAKDAEINQ